MADNNEAVSYTHLDVYKRQAFNTTGFQTVSLAQTRDIMNIVD